MSKSALQLPGTEPAPTTVLDTQRREYLTEDEVERIVKQAASERDRLMILMAYRHGLRVSELISMTWRQLDLDDGMDTLSLAAYLGHANIQNTKRYARMNAARFDGIWRD